MAARIPTTLAQSRDPLLKATTCQPPDALDILKSTSTFATTSPDGSEPNKNSIAETCLILTWSEGRLTPNNVAIRQRARFVERLVLGRFTISGPTLHGLTGNSTEAA